MSINYLPSDAMLSDGVSHTQSHTSVYRIGTADGNSFRVAAYNQFQDAEMLARRAGLASHLNFISCIQGVPIGTAYSHNRFSLIAFIQR
jgi:hypothetical protein